ASVTEQESEQEAVVAGEAVGEACLASNLTRMRHSASESGSCTCLNKLSSDRRPPATASARWTPRFAPSPRRRPRQQLSSDQTRLHHGPRLSPDPTLVQMHAVSNYSQT
ncbi:hypothetical protein PIB30_115322, partial [Stylosanthes scabra]|nr:hypothetical protein [Stylosanthes scabra]